MQIHCYLFQSTLDKPCRVHSRLDHVCGHFEMEPLLGNHSVIVKPRYFYSRRCYIFDIFVEPIMLLVIYLANPWDISRTITHGRCQHIVKRSAGSQWWWVRPQDAIIMVRTTERMIERGGGEQWCTG